MLPYLPFSSANFQMQMGVQPLGDRPLIEADNPRYRHEIAAKHTLLAADARYYAQALPGHEQAQWETLALVLHDLAQFQPQYFRLESVGDRWHWQNRLLDYELAFRFGDSSAIPKPLDWVGRQVQEDLLLLSGEEPFALLAGQLCFANMWSLDEKLGQSFLDIHGPVPAFHATLGRSSSLLMARLKPKRPVWRLNWSIKTNDWLDLSTRHAAADDDSKHGITPENAGQRCWLRVERQGLARLPGGAVLFTIHTYLTPIIEFAADHTRAERLLGVLHTMPHDMLAYKGIAPFAAPLCTYLERKELSRKNE